MAEQTDDEEWTGHSTDVIWSTLAPTDLVRNSLAK